MKKSVVFFEDALEKAHAGDEVEILARHESEIVDSLTQDRAHAQKACIDDETDQRPLNRLAGGNSIERL